MKAGIYETPNGNLIYVAKDRMIKATTLSPSSWPGMKVSHRSKDDTVLIEGTDYRCSRVSDVPNGCTDPRAALEVFYYTRRPPGRDERIADHQKAAKYYGKAMLANLAQATITNPRPIEEQAAELEAIAAEVEVSDPETAAEFRAGAKAVRNGGGFAIQMTPDVDCSMLIDGPDFSFPIDDPAAKLAELERIKLHEKLARLERTKLREKGYRIVHARSARKHRKQGHEVKYVPELRAYAWKVS